MTREKSKIKMTLGSFNLVKGIAMLLIVVGHMTSTVSWEKEPVLGLFFLILDVMKITALVIPMFFIISGFGFKEKSPMVMLKKTFSELILPCVYIMIALLVIRPIVFYCEKGTVNGVVQDTISYILPFALGLPQPKVIFGYTLRWCSASWHLYALFVALNVFNLVLKIKNKIKQIGVVVLCIGVGYLLVDKELIYYCIPQGLMAVGYCYIGYQLKQNKIIEQCTTKIVTYVIFVPIALMQITYGKFNLCHGSFNNIVLDYTGAACYAILFIFICVYLGKFEWKALDWIKEIGSYSYWIISIHSFELACFPWKNLKNILPDHQLLIFVCEVAVRSIFITVGCLVLKKIAKKKYKRKIAQSTVDKLARDSQNGNNGRI